MKSPTFHSPTGDPTQAAPQPKPKRRHHLVVIPEPRAPRRPRRTGYLAGVLFGLLIAMLASGAAAFWWQQSRIDTRQSRLVQTLRANRSLEQQTVTLRTKLADTQARIADMHGASVAAANRIERLRQRAASLRSRAVSMQSRIGDLRARTNAALASQAGTQQRLLDLAGPPLADGRYLAFVRAVGATPAPARLVIDVARTTDGVIENASPMLRVVEIARNAPIRITTWGHNNVTRRVSLDRFARIFTDPPAWLEPVTHHPYWAMVKDGRIVEVRELNAP